MCVSVCVCVPLKRWTLIQIKARCVSEIETKAAQTSSVCSCFLSLSPSVSLSHLALLCPPPQSSLHPFATLPLLLSFPSKPPTPYCQLQHVGT